jgi:hypothetical protein
LAPAVRSAWTLAFCSALTRTPAAAAVPNGDVTARSQTQLALGDDSFARLEAALDHHVVIDARTHGDGS